MTPYDETTVGHTSSQTCTKPVKNYKLFRYMGTNFKRQGDLQPFPRAGPIELFAVDIFVSVPGTDIEGLIEITAADK